MRKFFVGLVLVLSLGMMTQVVSAASANIFDLSIDTNGGANRFWVTDACEYYVSGQAVSGRPSFTSAEAYLGYIAPIWNGSVVSLGTINGTEFQSVQVQDNNIVKWGGLNIGGNFRFQFNNQQQAQNFAAFLTTLINANVLDTNCGLLYSYKVPGRNIVFSIDSNCVYRANGNVVGGENQWLSTAAATYNGYVRTMAYGNVTGNDFFAVNVQDNGVVKLSGKNIGGSFRFKFNSKAAGEPFGAFFQHAVDANVIDAGFVC